MNDNKQNRLDLSTESREIAEKEDRTKKSSQTKWNI